MTSGIIGLLGLFLLVGLFCAVLQFFLPNKIDEELQQEIEEKRMRAQKEKYS